MTVLRLRSVVLSATVARPVAGALLVLARPKSRTVGVAGQLGYLDLQAAVLESSHWHWHARIFDTTRPGTQRSALALRATGQDPTKTYYWVRWQ